MCSRIVENWYYCDRHANTGVTIAILEIEGGS
jgi:hypothetical protein